MAYNPQNLRDILREGLSSLAQNSLQNMLNYNSQPQQSQIGLGQSPLSTPSIEALFQPKQQPQIGVNQQQVDVSQPSVGVVQPQTQQLEQSYADQTKKTRPRKKAVVDKSYIDGKINEIVQQDFDKGPKKLKIKTIVPENGESKKTKAQQKEDDVAAKETLKYYQDTLKGDKVAKDNDLRLDRMEELVNHGSLPISSFYNFFKSLNEIDVGKQAPIVGPLAGLIANPVLNFLGGVGLDIQRNFTSKDTEEFEKLSNDFVRNIKDVFGPRVTNTDLEHYMKTIPTLSQSDAGKLKIIRNIRSFNKIIRLRTQAMKDIIKENKGKRPANLELLVEERLNDELNEAAHNFKSGTPVGQKVSFGQL